MAILLVSISKETTVQYLVGFVKYLFLRWNHLLSQLSTSTKIYKCSHHRTVYQFSSVSCSINTMAIRPVDSLEFHQICNKYNVSPFLVEEYCINRYRHKGTGMIYLLENHCMCSNEEKCPVCLPFEILELSHNPDHSRCRICARLWNYLACQMEFWYRYRDTILSNPDHDYEFVSQRDWSTGFSGLPNTIYNELELILDTPQQILREYHFPRSNQN